MHIKLKPDELVDVEGTLRYMVKNRYPSGNYPSSEGSESDHLVQWCHGAPGVTLTLAKAAEVFEGEVREEFLRAAADGGEVVWNRGLLKQVGICHGVSGNAYTFLVLYRLTGTGPKHSLAFYLTGLTSLYRRGRCMEVITPTWR
ncbi:hypothetical protein NE237_001103 [Protea cynaroides]|uniref:Uncharacterized protein n=1 Tax=Protea cynaroides TaxID=273540 RepID=A0A9Q0KSG1_9MAGN|nr:hypothetical protein NE237_001103 [Protea cynaroides]